jgi:dolichol-phosphate mannosyltransferase
LKTVSTRPTRPATGSRTPRALRPRPLPKLLSLVIPLYDEEEGFPALRAALERFVDQVGCDVEIVLVDDGSTDGTLDALCEWAQVAPHVKAISLSRNFGHQIAVTAGLDASLGEAVVIMDADLQDPPEVIPAMLEAYCEGYEVAYGQRIQRKDETFFKLASADVFYWIMRKFVDPRLPANVGDFRLMSRKVVDDLSRVRERDRFLRGLVAWIGHPQKAIPYVRSGRAHGETKYPVAKMVRLAISAITTFTDLPLRLVTWCGFASFALCVVLVVRTLWLRLFSPEPLVLGWASLSVLISFFAGLTLLSIGVLGIYVGKIFSEVQRRPLYLVQHSVNVEPAEER